MSQQPSQAFSTPPEPARHADGDVITGLQEGTVVLLSLVCTNPRYPSRPVAAVEGRVRIRPRARLADSTEARASLTTLYGVSVVTSFAGIFTLFHSVLDDCFFPFWGLCLCVLSCSVLGSYTEQEQTQRHG
ncbi:hypothetical protein CFAM422_011570 [Trichoderma lentiforme]|uniref:Uncharacterized protein n=1 Tax=Trichoderma lentiforme TaxID=1567552 RepID=A0A9P5C8D4_9HYPO|nr:hypothetical protein CFAM422_011570 [Trichoderma lentiforme]